MYFIIALVVIFIASGLRVLNEYERGVIFRLGRLTGLRGPGIIFIIPIVDKMVKISLRTIVLDVPSQDVITKDNVSVKVNAVVYFKVVDPRQAVVDVEDYYYATSQLAQTTLRSILGESELDELLASRESINHKLEEILDKQTDPWGVKVTNVEIKHVDLPKEMQRAMAKQAEAERERRAKVISAEAEFQASAKLSEAATIMSKEPITIQLRYLQTLSDIAVENNTTTIFPVPIDMMKNFMEKAVKK
jgi:regulator of protease activity HflC (stomatin/prohibitin superfamily)